MSGSEPQKVIFQSSDNVLIKIDKDVALRMSTVVKGVLEQVMEGYEHEPNKEHIVPFPSTTGRILELIVDWAENHRDTFGDPRWPWERRDENFKKWSPWERKFLRKSKQELKELEKTAVFLRMKDLDYAIYRAVRNGTRDNPNFNS